MDDIIFSGSWLWFIVFLVIWLGLLIYTKKKKCLFKDPKLDLIASKVTPFLLSLILVLIIVSNFQYTSKVNRNVINGFDNNTVVGNTEFKKSERMNSEDASKKLEDQINQSKESVKNDFN